MDKSQDYIIYGLTLVGEARGEPIEGIIGVASVIRNRFQFGYTVTNHKPKCYSDVCLEDKQFSCWNTNDHNYPFLIKLQGILSSGLEIDDIYVRQCMYIASGMMDWNLRDNTNGAQYYLARWLYEDPVKCPSWTRKLKLTAKLGNHVFMAYADTNGSERRT